MITSLSGPIQDKSSDHVVIEVGGVGLQVFLPSPTREGLQPGQRVSNMPLRSWVTFVRQEKTPIVWLSQNFLRHVQPGNEVELTWNLFPGEIYKGSVLYVGKAIGQGQWIPSGIAPVAPQPFTVCLGCPQKFLSTNGWCVVESIKRFPSAPIEIRFHDSCDKCLGMYWMNAAKRLQVQAEIERIITEFLTQFGRQINEVAINVELPHVNPMENLP